MKKSVDILGLPVISINEGNELGTAKGLVIDAAQGAVAAIVLEDGKWYLGAKLLPFTAVAGIGENALTTESSTHIITIQNAPELEKLLEADVKVIGAKVLTKNGRYQGKVSEIEMDETGRIVSCEIENGTEAKSVVEGEQVITFGKEVMIIADDDAAQIRHAAPSPSPASQPHPVAAAAATAEPVQPAKADAVEPPKPAQEPAAEDLSKKFDDKQRKYLLGKKATRKIETDNGVLIVEQNGEITEEVIQKAKLAGKFVELSMSI
ncbi:MAG: PRC-barrel domain protein [Firmicutes bacterium]|nr:PRC-barrel domain protein [Bacillota bacterium]